nr:hypothetical protein [Roseobacter litoralis]
MSASGRGVRVRRGRGGRGCIIAGGRSSPIYECFLILGAGQIANKPIQHGGSVAIPFSQIEQSATQDHFAAGVHFALSGGFTILKRLKTGLGLGVSLFGFLKFGFGHVTICLVSFAGGQFELVNVALQKQDRTASGLFVGGTWRIQHLQSAVVCEERLVERFLLERLP